ncbi:hypothetical protein INR49_022942 [Caranx melampygus]|nr:hypothetical protein INR49_022942 [Caranx melampygus]
MDPCVLQLLTDVSASVTNPKLLLVQMCQTGGVPAAAPAEAVCVNMDPCVLQLLTDVSASVTSPKLLLVQMCQTGGVVPAAAPAEDQEILRRLEKEKILVFTPSRRVQGRRVVCYDDRFIVKLAYESDGIIVSNDNYRDLANEKPEWKKFIDERLLMYSFVNDKRSSRSSRPQLGHFLRKRPIMPEQKKQPCPYGKKCTYGHKCKYYHPERGAQPQRAVANELRASAKTCVTTKNQGDAGLTEPRLSLPQRHRPAFRLHGLRRLRVRQRKQRELRQQLRLVRREALSGCPPDTLLEDNIHFTNPHSRLYPHHASSTHDPCGLHPADYTNIPHGHTSNTSVHSYHMSVTRGQSCAHDQPPPEAPSKRPSTLTPPSPPAPTAGRSLQLPGRLPLSAPVQPPPSWFPSGPLSGPHASRERVRLTPVRAPLHIAPSPPTKSFAQLGLYYRQPPLPSSRYEPSAYQSCRTHASHPGTPLPGRRRATPSTTPLTLLILKGVAVDESAPHVPMPPHQPLPHSCCSTTSPHGRRRSLRELQEKEKRTKLDLCGEGGSSTLPSTPVLMTGVACLFVECVLVVGVTDLLKLQDVSNLAADEVTSPWKAELLLPWPAQVSAVCPDEDPAQPGEQGPITCHSVCWSGSGSGSDKRERLCTSDFTQKTEPMLENKMECDSIRMCKVAHACRCRFRCRSSTLMTSYRTCSLAVLDPRQDRLQTPVLGQWRSSSAFQGDVTSK